MNQENKMKVIFVGDGGVGKSSIVSGYSKQYIVTMGAEIHPKEYNTYQGKIRMNCWDCAGENKFQGLGDQYYNGAHVAVVVFSVNSRVSYRNVEHWIRMVREKCEGIYIILCGNKADLNERKIQSDEVLRKQEELGFDHYIETSAKLNEGVRQLFTEILREYLGNNNQVEG